MERLTVPDKKIDGGYQRAVIDTREVKKYAMNIYWELKKYEDTGLTPEQIIELKERDTAKAPRAVSERSHYACCLNCGEIIFRDYKFCPECGQRLK